LQSNTEGEIPLIKAGSVDQLVKRLIYYKYPDPDYTETFLLTYRSFISPVDLLNKIIFLYPFNPMAQPDFFSFSFFESKINQNQSILSTSGYFLNFISFADTFNQDPPQNLTQKQFQEYYSTKVIPTRLRVINVLKSWIDKHFEDFETDEPLEEIIMSFLTNPTTYHYQQEKS